MLSCVVGPGLDCSLVLPTLAVRAILFQSDAAFCKFGWHSKAISLSLHNCDNLTIGGINYCANHYQLARHCIAVFGKAQFGRALIL